MPDGSANHSANPARSLITGNITQINKKKKRQNKFESIKEILVIEDMVLNHLIQENDRV